MNNIYFCGVVVCVSSVISTGCGASGGNNATANRAAANSNVAVVTNANTSAGARAVNSISNTVSSAATSSPDTFMTDAALGGMREVETGKIASTKAANPEVRKFGQMMVTDHTKANEELKALAAKKGVTLPTAPDSSTQSMISDLKGKTGADFDSEYINSMADDHQETVDSFEKQAQNGTDPEVKAFAAKTLPVLRKHLETVKALQTKLDNG